MLRRSAVALLLLCGLISGSRAGEPVFISHGAGQAGVSFACVASYGHWNSFHNQALMAGYNDLTAGFSLESRFMMPEMASKCLSLIIPGSKAPLGLIISHYGNGQYSLVYGGLGSAVNLTDGLSIGAQADIIYERSIGEYQDVTHITFETGLAANIAPSLALGFHVFNPLAVVNNLPSTIRVGVSWTHNYGLIMTFEMTKVTGEPLSLHGGFDWEVLGKLSLRTGYMSSPSVFSFGAGYSYGQLHTDIGFLINNLYGITPSISFTWKIKK